jgi:metal-responsive CopG/Arc/MetJ family transcriptional regulator
MVMARKQVLVQLDEHLVAQLDRIGELTGQNRSALLRTAARTFVQLFDEAEKDDRLVEGYRRRPQTQEELDWITAIQYVEPSDW